MQVNWQYLGGFFDAHGSVITSLSRSGKAGSKRVYVEAQIATHSSRLRQLICAFLKTNGIFGRVTQSTNKLGVSARVYIGGLVNVQTFARALLPYCIIKRKSLQLLLKIIRLARKTGGDLVARLGQMDVIRHELHALSVKGPKKLVKW